MENAKKPVYKVLFALNLVLLAAALALCVVRLIQPDKDVFGYTNDAIYVLAILSGFVYAISGYKKAAANYYKGFMFLFCLETLFLVIYDLATSKASGSTSSISQILETIVCVNLCILTFTKDLGKKTSVGLVCAVLGVTLINSGRLIILYSSILGVVARAVISLILAIVAGTFVIEKYADKAARGTN